MIGLAPARRWSLSSRAIFQSNGEQRGQSWNDSDPDYVNLPEYHKYQEVDLSFLVVKRKGRCTSLKQ